MGGFFGIVSNKDCALDLFFGIDYHSHLGNSRAGMVVYSKALGFQRAIHNISNAPFRTKFEKDITAMSGNAGIGCISDQDPQPLIVRSHLGSYAITAVGRVNNEQELMDRIFQKGSRHFLEMSGGQINSIELVAALLSEQDSVLDGLLQVQESIQGTMSVLLLTEEGIYAARDRLGRLPVVIGRREDGYCVSFESFAYQKLGYSYVRDLGPGEIVRITNDGVEVLSPPRDTMRMCAFLWTYYGYPTSQYEGISVESMRYRNGAALAESDAISGFAESLDFVAGVPDSGTGHAIGYANHSRVPFARPFIKYTPTWPRSFIPTNQEVRNLVARMKLIPIDDLIRNRRLLFIDDSIVRGTQMRETVEFLYESGAKEVHIRSACPPILFGCKYLNFSRSTSEMDLITRRTIHQLEGSEADAHLEEYARPESERGQAMSNAICQSLHFSSLRYQSLSNMLDAIGISPCKICTYCWTGKE